MARMARISLVACVLVSVILIGGGAFTASADTRRKIVSFRPVTNTLCWLLHNCLDLTEPKDMEKAIAAVLASGASVVHPLPVSNALAVELPGNDLLGTLTDLVNSLYVLEIVDDLLTMVDPICPSPALPSIPESYPWGQLQIEVPAVHPEWQGSGVKVAILDTGIATHCEFSFSDDSLCLSSRVAMGYNALAGQIPWMYLDDHGHGTHMAGVIAANLNSVLPVLPGIVGVAPQATLAAVKVLDSTGYGYLSDVVNGLQWVYDQNMNKPVSDQIRVVNMSFGFPSDSTPLREAIKSVKDSGVIMVASAGNHCPAATVDEDGGGDGCYGGPAASCQAPLTAITYPAAYQGVLAVGATDIHNHVTDYSLLGSQLDVVAPGGAPESGAPDNGQILSTNTGGLYGLGHGTSQAAAHVTGAVGLALQLQPGLSFAQVSNLLKTTAVKLTDPSTGQPYPKEKQGEGRIDVEKMIEELLP